MSLLAANSQIVHWWRRGNKYTCINEIKSLYASLHGKAMQTPTLWPWQNWKYCRFGCKQT